MSASSQWYHGMCVKHMACRGYVYVDIFNNLRKGELIKLFPGLLDLGWRGHNNNCQVHIIGKMCSSREFSVAFPQCIEIFCSGCHAGR